MRGRQERCVQPPGRAEKGRADTQGRQREEECEDGVRHT